MEVPDTEEKPPFHRRVLLEERPGHVRAEVEDHQHHFVVTVHHDGERVTEVDGVGVRIPWVTCTDATALLDELVGAPVGVRATTDRMDQHCTHQIDLALLAVRFAGAGVTRREYRTTVTGYLEPVTTATLRRDDDGYELTWVIEDGGLVTPGDHAGQSLTRGLSAWLGTLAPDEAEAVSVLRRAVWVAPSRLFDLDRFATLADVGMPEGVCYAAQPQRIRLLSTRAPQPPRATA